MKITQQDGEFRPVAIILETQEEMGILWDMMLRVKRASDKDKEFEMACAISDWISNKAHL
jgi:hypothetical protein